MSIAGDRQSGTTAERDGRRYLLFAGTVQPPNGGLGDLVDTFMSEETARRAFREIRLRTSSTTGWAQLAVIEPQRGIRPLCWFGIGAEPERWQPALDAPALEPRMHSAGRPHVPTPVILLITMLVAVATITLAVLIDNNRSPSPVNRQPAVSVPLEVAR